MGLKVRQLFGSSAFIRYAVWAFILVFGSQKTFGAVIIVGPLPPWGSLQVIIDAPDNINSAGQRKIGDNPNFNFSSWFNNGDVASLPAGDYSINFCPIAGWGA